MSLGGMDGLFKSNDYWKDHPYKSPELYGETALGHGSHLNLIGLPIILTAKQ